MLFWSEKLFVHNSIIFFEELSVNFELLISFYLYWWELKMIKMSNKNFMQDEYADCFSEELMYFSSKEKAQILH